MSIEFWSVYVMTVFLASIIPGPSMILALTHGIKYGARRAIATALGNSVASFLQAVVSIAGLGALLAASETAFMLVKYAGAAYLVWLGIGVLLSGDFNFEDSGHGEKETISTRKLFLQGFWVAAGNPKAIVFFSALFPQFISSGQASIQHFAMLLTLLTVIAFGCMMIYACGGEKIKGILKGTAICRYINKALGTAFVGLGISLACSKR
ncbi:LysE family translocator [Desulfovibrio sp. JC022]|uniref:LysE family translocator n=1 Tax=Desulfovibrio sp. JC022 TaxID=2593642 RepID=UPI0013D64916|nr:LysE family translocator [Desulfovibrio sp. JC022]NDV22398.1 LysE family translocator [Desulfovibrio sp. JC022]